MQKFWMDASNLAADYNYVYGGTNYCMQLCRSQFVYRLMRFNLNAQTVLLQDCPLSM